MQHRDFNDNSPDKIDWVSYLFHRELEQEWIEYSEFLSIVEGWKDEALEKIKEKEPDFDGNPLYIFPLFDSDSGDVYLEYWCSRMETDEEWKKRQQSIKDAKKIDMERDLKRLRYLADHCGYELVKK